MTQTLAGGLGVFTPTCPREGAPQRFLVYGRTGWIGGKLGRLLEERGAHWAWGAARMEDRAAVLADLQREQPTHVLLAAGVTGRPNVDWCEDHQAETIRANVLGVVTVVDVCAQAGVHVTYFGTGCIFTYDDKHPLGSGVGFKDDDPPNFTGSFYSKTKAMCEDLLRSYPNVLTLRVRMPVDEDLTCPRNFVTKITKYPKVVDIPNSLTVLPELLPLSLDLASRNAVGSLNLTNPGTLSHNQVLALYRDHVDPHFTWVNFTEEEQAQVLKAPRSNNHLDTARLTALFPHVRHVRESLLHYVFRPKGDKLS